MSKNYHITINIIHPRNGRKYRRGDNMIERHIVNIGETVNIDSSLSFCIGQSQMERTVKYNGTNNNIHKQDLLDVITNIINTYTPHNRATALMSPENYNKVFISIDSTEYMLERASAEAAALMQAIDCNFIRGILVKEKLQYLKYGPSSNLSTTANIME